MENIIAVTIGNVLGGAVCLGAALWYIYGKEQN